MTKGSYPFSGKQAQYRKYTIAELNFAIKDATEARDVCGPDTFGWYSDDVCTIRDELNRRTLYWLDNS